MPHPGLSLAVVGADHPNKRGPARRFEIALCLPGEAVDLRFEPKNPTDPNAIAVFSGRGVQIGYVRAERTQWVGSLIRSARVSAAVFQCKETWGATIRLGLDGADAVLPVERTLTKPDLDPQQFWPDEIPPDE